MLEGRRQNVIKLTDVEKAYESGAGKTWVLRRINLEIADGEFVTIMGPSGAGKSTLMGIIGMLDGAWKGEYYLVEHAVHKLDNRHRVELHKKYIGFVFQQYHLLDNLTVAENLDLPLSYRDIKKAEREGLVAEARAVIGKPKLILADEPTGSLHSSQGKMIMDMLKKLNDDGTTIVQVTHNDAWAAYGHRIVQLADGWIVNGQTQAGAA